MKKFVVLTVFGVVFLFFLNSAVAADQAVIIGKWKGNVSVVSANQMLVQLLVVTITHQSGRNFQGFASFMKEEIPISGVLFGKSFEAVAADTIISGEIDVSGNSVAVIIKCVWGDFPYIAWGTLKRK